MRSIATRDDVNAVRADLSVTLAASRDAVLDRLVRGLRRSVLTLGTVMVATGAVAVMLA
jgi:hypothetical protein